MILNSINNIKILKIKKGTILITKSLSSPDNINFRLFLAENIENLKYIHYNTEVVTVI